MRTVIKSMVSALALAVIGLGSQPAAAGSAPEATPALLKLGERTYLRECSMCHSDSGDGQGPGAYILNPKPRNFELGVYKLRSTPNGEVPTPHDLFKTITKGIPNSMMPGFAALSERERWGLVHVLLRFGALEDEEATAIEVPPAPASSSARVANGEKLYVKLKCATCHGADGWGDGPASLTLKNDAKERVFPANLTTGVFKGGSTAEDLYTRIATGMDGSPMPSYANEATPDEIWDLVYYMQSLVR